MPYCVFLGGPIQYAIDQKGRFSTHLRELLEQLLSSLDAAGYRVLSAHRDEKFGKVDTRGKYSEVCIRDYNWMQECDAFAAVLPAGSDGLPISSCGTSVELGWASAMGKPVVLLLDSACQYSHLIAGLHSVTTVVTLDIKSPSLSSELCQSLEQLAAPSVRSAGGYAGLAHRVQMQDQPPSAKTSIVSKAELQEVWPQYGDTEREGLLRVLASSSWCRLKDEHWQEGECGQFEREFGAYLDAEHVLAVTNGTVAIELGLMALGLEPGDEVLVQAGTFFGTVTPILKRCAVPVFADFVTDACTVDPASLKARVSEKTRGVIVVPLCGVAPDMDSLTAFCQDRGLWLLEDCAQAVGTRWRGRSLGTLGDIGTFSFQQDKPLQSGEGGAVVCRDAELLGRVFAYHQGFSVNGAPDFDRHRPGTNSRMTSWQAAVLRAQLQTLDRFIATRSENHRILESLLSPDDPIRPVPRDLRMDRWSMFSAPFLYDACKNRGISRDAFLYRLQQAGVPATEGHVEPLYLRPLFRENELAHRYPDCPVTERISRESYFSIMHWFFLGPPEWMERLVRWLRDAESS